MIPRRQNVVRDMHPYSSCLTPPQDTIITYERSIPVKTHQLLRNLPCTAARLHLLHVPLTRVFQHQDR